VLQKIKDDKTVYVARGKVYQDMGNHKLAIDDFNEAIRHCPKLSEGFYRRGQSKISSQMFHDAERDFKRALELENQLMDE